MRTSLQSPFQGKIKTVLKCIRCGNRGNIRISSFENLTLSLQSQFPVNNLSDLLSLHFKNEILENVYCGHCSWQDFKSQIEKRKLKKKQITKTSSEQNFKPQPPKNPTQSEILQFIWDELHNISKYDIKEIDRLGAQIPCLNLRIQNRVHPHQIGSQKSLQFPKQTLHPSTRTPISENQNHSGKAKTNSELPSHFGHSLQSGGLQLLGGLSKAE